MTVDDQGVLLFRGEPYRGIGVNYFNAFQRRLLNPEDLSYREGFKVLAQYEIPFVRMMAGGFWPYEWELYRKDRERYFEWMDDVVRVASDVGIGIIPSLFWWYPCVPDLAGEPVKAWGNPDSATQAFMREYVEAMVTRYRDEQAIWAWEFGNEYNLSSDLPNAMDHLPWVRPDWGTPVSRGEDDVLTGEALIAALKGFGEAVRRHDTVRPITSGHAILRSSSWHQRRELSWKRDSREQHVSETLELHPDPINMLSTHVYPEALSERYFGRDGIGFQDLLGAAIEASSTSRKPLFVGEFGSPAGKTEEEIAEARKAFEALLAAVVESGVPLAALWVFDYAPQEDQWNVRADNALLHRLEAVRDVNRKLKARVPETEQPKVSP